MRDRLLVRHFLLRFLDHDLISPHADRREVLTIACAMVVVSSLFLSFFLAVKYQFNLFLPPGLTAIVSLDDRFFLFSLSMIAMALIAVAEWDALALDARDAAILAPLPIPVAVIVRAKFTAIALFAIAFDVGLGIGPTVLRPLALPVKLPISMAGALRLTAAHAICAVLAGGFGFVAVLGVREFCRAILGATSFRRVSAALQATLLVLLLTALLLLPSRYPQVALRWMTHSRVSAVAVPPLWFVGLHEVMAGGVIDGLPRAAPPRRFARAEADATALYRSLSSQFHRLAAVAVGGFAAVFLLTAALCAWNHRRLPSEIAGSARRSRRLARLVESAARRTIARAPAGQAGFFFTLQTLTRNATHRVTLAAAVAVAFAIAVVTLSAARPHDALAWSTVPVPVLAIQTFVITVLLAGFRHLVRVPADLRASWTFRLAWSGDDRGYVEGSKRAALTLLAGPAVLALSVVGVVEFGARMAVAHAIVGAAVSVLVLDLLLLSFRTLPFAAAYAGAGDLKAIVPLGAMAALIAAMSLAAIERATVSTATGGLALFATLVVTIAAVHLVARRRASVPADMEFDDLPAAPTQRLELTR